MERCLPEGCIFRADFSVLQRLYDISVQHISFQDKGLESPRMLDNTDIAVGKEFIVR